MSCALIFAMPSTLVFASFSSLKIQKFYYTKLKNMSIDVSVAQNKRIATGNDMKGKLKREQKCFGPWIQ